MPAWHVSVSDDVMTVSVLTALVRDLYGLRVCGGIEC